MQRPEAPTAPVVRCGSTRFAQAAWSTGPKPAVRRDEMTRETLLAKTLVELADTLVADFDVVDLLTLVADRCVDVLDVGAAGLMLASPDGDLRVMASSSEAMRVLELFEVQAQEGP